MKIGHIEFFVSDTMASISFYRDILGFELMHFQDGKFAWLRLGTCEILLRPAVPGIPDVAEKKEYQDASIGIVLYTDDLDKTAGELMSRGLEIRGTDASDRCLTFTDPDGNWFQLVNPEDH